MRTIHPQPWSHPLLHSLSDIQHQERYIQTADTILSGHVDIFSLHKAHLSHPPHWNTDPRTGTVAPSTLGLSIDYRDERHVGDIKYLWETNRHLQLATIAQAYNLSKDPKYLDGLKLQLESWLEQCPYLSGPQWTSALELGIRLINWSLIWSLIGEERSALFEGTKGQEFMQRWLQSIYQHCDFINDFYSAHSSANNHLIGEAAGVFIASTTWPFWPKSSHWRDRAKTILEREAISQNSSDGVNREQATAYQLFVLDFMLLSLLSAKKSGQEFSSDFSHRFERMLEYISAIMDYQGNVPFFGDADDGFVTRLSQEPGWCPFKSLLATGAILFERQDFKAKAGKLDDKNLWLFGASGKQIFDRLSPLTSKQKTHRIFPQGGVYILGGDFDTVNEIQIIADAGPLGYLSIAAHGHADALSFTLSSRGEQILVDPGTYAYHSKKKWRDYFRGTAAHNTVCIDGLNQSVIGGNFMWLQKALPTVHQWHSDAQCDRLIASHDGYMRLSDPVEHIRELEFLKLQKRIIITDTIKCNGEHRVDFHWHFSEQCRLDYDGGVIHIHTEQQSITLQPPAQIGDCQLIRGQKIPPMGWISRSFDHKQPTTSAVCSTSTTGSQSYQTVIQL